MLQRQRPGSRIIRPERMHYLYPRDSPKKIENSSKSHRSKYQEEMLAFTLLSPIIAWIYSNCHVATNHSFAIIANTLSCTKGRNSGTIDRFSNFVRRVIQNIGQELISVTWHILVLIWKGYPILESQTSELQTPYISVP